MKRFFKENFLFIVFFLFLLISSLSAVNFFNSSNIFTAKISYVNDLKYPFSVIVNVENKVNTSLPLNFQVLYTKQNLVVGSKNTICSQKNCYIKIDLSKVFFDKHQVIIRTHYKNKYYQKILDFNLQNKINNYLNFSFKKNYYTNGSAALNISSHVIIKSDKPEKFYVEIYPQFFPQDKETFQFSCYKNCNKNFELKNNIIFGKYDVRIYTPTNSLADSFNVVFQKSKKNINNNSNSTPINFKNSTQKLNISVFDHPLIPANFLHLKINRFPKFSISNLTSKISVGSNFSFNLYVSPTHLIINKTALSLPSNLKILSKTILPNGTMIFKIKGIAIKSIQNVLIKHDYLDSATKFRIYAVKPVYLRNYEKKLNVIVDQISNISSKKNNFKLLANKTSINFKNASLFDVHEIEVFNASSLKGKKNPQLKKIKTKILYVNATNFSSAKVVLPKSVKGKKVDKILTCKKIISNTCIGGWSDTKFSFNQNATDVWFTAPHFSAYMGVGPSYVFNVDFTNYGPTSIKHNQAKNVSLNVSCDATGNCGIVNVTLYYKVLNTSYFQNFETGSLNPWIPDGTSGCTFSTIQGPTPSGSTGPSVDHTLGTSSGWYSYVETSANGVTPPYYCDATDNTASLTSQNLSLGLNPLSFSFWYYMYGSQIGTLHVDLYNNGIWTPDVWSLTGQQQTSSTQAWRQAKVNLTAYSGVTALRFRYDGMTGYMGDIGIDDLSMDVWGKPILNTPSTPLWSMGSITKQISLSANQNKIVNFDLNATGPVNSVVTIYGMAQKSNDPTVVSQTNDKNITIADAVPPSVTLQSPSNGAVSSTNSVTFSANASDNTKLGSASLRIWDSVGNLVYSGPIQSLSGTSASFSTNYNFTNSGTFKWNYKVLDAGGNIAYASQNRTFTIAIPEAKATYLNFADPYPVLVGHSRPFKVNVTCIEGNCGPVNVTLYQILHIPPFNYFENFESASQGNWTPDGTSGCTFSLIQGPTPSSNTGPSVDHTLGTASGWYSYVETSNKGTTPPYYCGGGDTTAMLTSQNFTAGTNTTTFSFWYYMYGSQIGTLHVDVYNGGSWIPDVWTLSGQQQTSSYQPWRQAVINLNSYRGKIGVRLRYDGMGGWRGDIGVDDLNLSTTNLPKKVFPTISTTPFWTNSTNPIHIPNMNLGDSKILTFYINATGVLGNRTPAYLETDINPSIGFNDIAPSFNFSIDGPSPPVGHKLTPANGASSPENNMTFNSTVTSRYGLSNATLYIWNSTGGLIGTNFTDFSSSIPTDANTSSYFQYFTYPNAYKWGILYNDIYGDSSWADNNNWTLHVYDTPPWAGSWSWTGTNGASYNRTQSLKVSGQFYDKLQLGYSYLEHNGLGYYHNFSKPMSGRSYLQNYTLNLWNASQFATVGPMTIKAMHGFDISNLEASITSPKFNFILYGFADITKILPNPAAVGDWGQSSLVYCQVADNYTGLPIVNYPVKFYDNVTGYIGSNTTNSLGRAYIKVNVSQMLNISCNISNALPIYYYAHKKQASTVINRDQIPPSWYNWGINYVGGGAVPDGAHINKTQKIFAHSFWQDNYELYYAYLEHNGSGTPTNYSINPFPTVLDSPTSWANFSFDFANASQFKVGLVNVSATYGSDKANNINKTTPSHYFYLYGFANVSSFVTNDSIYPNASTIRLTCNITDNTSRAPVANYPVTITSNQTGIIYSGFTNSLGEVSTIYNDTTPGKENLTCSINPHGYYYTDISSKSLGVTDDVIPPFIVSNYSLNPIKVHPGESSKLSAIWSEPISRSLIHTDKGDFPVTSYLGNSTSGTITTDLSWPVGPHNVDFIDTYDMQNNENFSSNNLTLFLYHYANVSAETLSQSSIFINNSIVASCQIKDSNLNTVISGYNVSFYSNGAYIGSSSTDSTGWASISYTPTVSGIYNIKCNISTDNVHYYDPLPGGNSSSKLLSVASLNGRACSGDVLSVPYNNYFDSVLNDGFMLRTGPNCNSGNANFASWFNYVTSYADSYWGYNRGPYDSTAIHSDGFLDAGPNLRLMCRSGGRTPEESYTHLHENINPASLIGLKFMYYYANRQGNALSSGTSPAKVVLFPYTKGLDNVNSTNYLNVTFNPKLSACTGESLSNGYGQPAYYQEINAYSMIPKFLAEGLSTVDMRMAIYAQANYNNNNGWAEWNYNEFELYTKILSVDMLTPLSTVETYMNKTQSLTCSVPTAGANTSNVVLYPQYCSGNGCINYTNIQTGTGSLRVNQSSYSCSATSCSNTFYINYSKEGNYSIRCNATNFNSYSAVSSAKNFIVYRSDLNIANISHDKDSINQYEVGDTIKSINVSVYNNNRGKAYGANYTFSIINSSGSIPSWLITLPKTTICQNPIGMNSFCNSSFDNFGSGFVIPNSTIPGTYNFSVNLKWLNIGNILNTSKSFKILDLRTGFNSSANPSKVNSLKSSILTFNMSNPWVANLNSLNVSINCEQGFICKAISNNSNQILKPGNIFSAIFNVTATANATIGENNFTFNVSYINPRKFSKHWDNVNKVVLNLTQAQTLNINKKYSLSKNILSLGNNSYRVILNVTNNENLPENILVPDFVDSDFNAYAFTPNYNFSNTTTGKLFNGKIYFWNLTVSNSSTILINYTLSGSNDYKLKNNYVSSLG